MDGSAISTLSNVTGQPGKGKGDLVKQLSEKVRSQAERLQRLESYKSLCEKRIKDFQPDHQFPI